MGWKKKVVLFVETSRCYGRNIIYGFSKYAAERRSWTLYFQDRGVWESAPRSIPNWECDAVVSRSSARETFELFQRLNVPVIELLGDEETFFPAIKNDEKVNCRMAADHFFRLGYNDFAFFAVSDTPWARTRLQCFQDALDARSAQVRSFSTYPFVGESGRAQVYWGWWEQDEQKILAWLRDLPRPTAILCEWDMSAFLLINICNNAGISIPEEIAILGYGNNADLCGCSSPTLSSVASNGREVGYQAAHLLDLTFQGEPLPELPILAPATHIAERQSTRRLGIDDPTLIKALDYIRNNIAKRPSIVEIARFANVSPSTLGRLFRKKLGRSPEEEVLKTSVNWAKELLVETDYPIDKIAEFLSYSNGTSFARAFRRETGTTPSEFRASGHN